MFKNYPGQSLSTFEKRLIDVAKDEGTYKATFIAIYSYYNEPGDDFDRFLQSHDLETKIDLRGDLRENSMGTAQSIHENSSALYDIQKGKEHSRPTDLEEIFRIIEAYERD